MKIETYCCIAVTVLGVLIGNLIVKYFDLPASPPAKFEYICTRNGSEYIKTPEGGLDLSVDSEGAAISCEPVVTERGI